MLYCVGYNNVLLLLLQEVSETICLLCHFFFLAKIDVTLQVQCTITQSSSQSCIGAEDYYSTEYL